MLIPNSQILGLTQKFQKLQNRDAIKFSLITNAEMPNQRDYFSKFIAEDFSSLESVGFKYYHHQSGEDVKNVDIVILTAHGQDLSKTILEMKEANSDLIVATWFWDNHLSYLPNYKTAVISDIYYPSHAYCKEYLMNPCSPIGYDVPACTAQWTKNELDFKGVLVATKRESKILLNYVDYKFSWRTKILNELQKFMPDAHTRIMLPENRDSYFTLTQLQKYQQWCSYKSTLILPVEKDLSTRVFDALFAGQILIVPTMVEDFDNVIPKELQNELGIIRIKSLDLSTIQLAAQKAFEIFDNRGISGMIKRFEFVLENHMLIKRVEIILKNIESLSSSLKNIKFKHASNSFGLFVS
jgi:hypothetical protein